MNKAILYYTHNSLPIEMEEFFQKKLLQASKNIPIVSVFKNARNKFSSNFAAANIECNVKQNNWHSILAQMQLGIDHIINTYGNSCTVYIAEHDVLYPETYFNIVPTNMSELMKNKNLFFLTKDGFLGPYNTHIHSQTIGSASLFDFCLKEDVDSLLKKFKTKCNYKLTLYNSENPCVDVRHGFNYTGPRGNASSLYKQQINFWGNYKDLISQIPNFKY
jgi:hypothetical protein